jgi:hypothetical protein
MAPKTSAPQEDLAFAREKEGLRKQRTLNDHSRTRISGNGECKRAVIGHGTIKSLFASVDRCQP